MPARTVAWFVLFVTATVIGSIFAQESSGVMDVMESSGVMDVDDWNIGLPQTSSRMMKRGRGMTLCGEQLVNVLSVVCRGRYVGDRNYGGYGDLLSAIEGLDLTMKKRSAPRKLINPASFSRDVDSLGSEVFSGLGMKKKRSVGGLADTCCRRSCTFQQLRQFCSK